VPGEPPAVDVAAVSEFVGSMLYPEGSRLPTASWDQIKDAPIRSMKDIRHALSLVDHQVAPSPLSVRFGPEDLEERDIGGIRLLLDREDVSVSKTIIDGFVYEPHLRKVFEDTCRPGMTVVDVGANVGYFSLIASDLVGSDGRVIAIEPNSENCRLVLLSMLANKSENIELLPVALDRKQGWSYFTNHIGSNGGLIEDESVQLSDGRGFVVPTFRLDDVVEGRVDFIKLDAEGAEGRVLAGAARIIESYRPTVTSEFSLEMLGRVSGVSGEDYLKWFTSRGYTPFVIEQESEDLTRIDSIEDWLNERPEPSKIQDLLFVPRS
jgi:FkbM family methyltransferase